MDYRKIYFATAIGISAALVGTAGTALADNYSDDGQSYGSHGNSSYEEHEWSRDDYRNGNYSRMEEYWNSRDGKNGYDGNDGKDGHDGSYGRDTDNDDYGHSHGNSNDDDDDQYTDDDDGDDNDDNSYVAELEGEDEVPSRASDATGDFSGTVNSDEDEMDYDLDVSDGEDVTMSHLHCASEGENGPIVVTLFHNEDGVDVDGNLASGTFDNSDIEATAHDCDNPIYDIEDLNREIIEGNIYVNVHTKKYPAGEIRGQLEEANMNDDDDDDYGDNNHHHSGSYDDDDDDNTDYDGHHGSSNDDEYDNDDSNGRDWMNDMRDRMQNRINDMRDRMHERMSNYH